MEESVIIWILGCVLTIHHWIYDFGLVFFVTILDLTFTLFSLVYFLVFDMTLLFFISLLVLAMVVIQVTY